MDPDLPVIQALQGGDDTALNALIARHSEALHRFVFRYVRNEATARDLVQETFVRVYFKASKYRPQSSVKTWIYMIAVNLCRDHHRRETSRGNRPIPENLTAPTERLPEREAVDSALTPSAHAARTEEFALLKEAIDTLPHSLKSALVLFSLEGHSQKEAADILGTSPKTIELRVYRAKDRLRKALSGLLGKGQA